MMPKSVFPYGQWFHSYAQLSHTTLLLTVPEAGIAEKCQQVQLDALCCYIAGIVSSDFVLHGVFSNEEVQRSCKNYLVILDSTLLPYADLCCCNSVGSQSLGGCLISCFCNFFQPMAWHAIWRLCSWADAEYASIHTL